MASDDGFTLLEMLVAIAVVSLMAVPLAEAIRTGLYAWSETHERTEQSQRIHLAHDRLRGWLQNAYPAYYDRVPGGMSPLEGTATELQFITALNGDRRADDFHRATLTLSADATLDILAKSDHAYPDSPCDADDLDCSRATLLRSVSSVTLAYYDSDAGAWRDDWQGRVHLPDAIRIGLEFQDSTSVWPDLVVRLERDQWSHCEFQPTLLECS